MKKNYLYVIFIFTLLIIYLFNSTIVINGVLQYTELFFKKLFPACFIFFVIGSLLLEYNFPYIITKILHINGASFYVILLSMISGFPSGSKYISDLYKKDIISLKLANYLIMFTHFPNPIFVLGSISLLFKDNLYAIYILISLILSNLIIGIIFRPKNKEFIKCNINNNYNFSDCLNKNIINSIKTIILIYGVSVFFYLVSNIISKYFSSNIYNYILVNGVFDLTNGVFLTSLIRIDFIKALFILFFISFGGISINMQVKSIISDTNISYYKFLVGRLLQFIFSIIIFLIIIYWSSYFN